MFIFYQYFVPNGTRTATHYSGAGVYPIRVKLRNEKADKLSLTVLAT